MAIIRARHRPFFTWFFRLYSQYMFRSHFSRTRIHGNFQDRGFPVLMIGNHFSWWDGFIAHLLNIRVFHRRFHVMMLEEQLAGRKFLSKAGAYSINKGSRTIAESFAYTKELLIDPQNLTVMYPQGEFQSLAQYPVKFQKGADRLFREVDGKVHLVFYVALVDFFENKRPSLDIYFGHFEDQAGHQDHDLETLFNRFLKECIDQQLPGR